MIKRILILRGGALGDFLVTLPALGLLRTRWPAARIELVGNATAAELGVIGGYLDAVHSQHEARWSPLYGHIPLPSPLIDWLGEFDLVLTYWPDPDQTLVRRFPVRAGQTFLSGTAAPRLAPAARHFCAPLKALGLSTDDFRSRLEVQRVRGNALHRKPTRPLENGFRRPIAIHPGSGSARKNWPADRWLELVGRLAGPILVVLGEAEPATWNGALRALLGSAAAGHAGRRTRPGAPGTDGIEFAINRPLPELAAALASSRLFIGHDSGVSHLAAAVGAPAVLLFGPTDPAMWAPPGDHVRVIRRGAILDAISVEDVLGACRAHAVGSRLVNEPGDQ